MVLPVIPPGYQAGSREQASLGNKYQIQRSLLQILDLFVIHDATRMMKPDSRRHLLFVSLALLLAVTACNLSPLRSEAPDGNPQPGSQSAPDAQTASPPSGEDAQAGESAVDTDCTDLNPHPIGASIAADYEVSYEQVMTWFCSGYSFENILIALETSEAVDVPAEALLEMLLEKEWEEIWVEVGLTGGP